MCEGSNEDRRPLKKEDIRWFEIMADTRFDCVFWGSSVRLRWVIKRLLAHIRWMEAQRAERMAHSKDRRRE